MQIGYTYKTWAHSKRTSSATYASEDVKGAVLLNYSGELHWGRKLEILDARHIWLTASNPVTVVAKKGGVVQFTATDLSLYTTSFNEDGIVLEVYYPEPSGLLSETSILQLQVLASALNVTD